jgi:hypothetical protein
MRLPLFLVAAVVLIVFAIIAGATASGLCLGSSWFVWAAASLLAYYADILFGGFGYVNGAWGRGDRAAAPPA